MVKVLIIPNKVTENPTTDYVYKCKNRPGVGGIHLQYQHLGGREFEASLVYKESSRIAGAVTQRKVLFLVADGQGSPMPYKSQR